ncbi:protein kinase domain-containing protein [Haliangium sp.]|uniref:serine/threonine protein kinase n=1 Tax=Haliangium sp. TaxID=2663208 RepID=UPI003D0A8ED8
MEPDIEPQDPDDTEAEDPRVGTVLQGRYRLLEPLAAGGMGVVYRGERVHLGRPVAIKFLHADFAANAESQKRFERELRAMSRLTHPNCISVIDFGIGHDNAPYIVMELVSGRDLKRVLADEGRLPPPRALFIASQILAALAHAHSHNMVHRDIKPANIILADVEGTLDHVYVLDFGLAKFMSKGGLTGDDLTASWMVVGTPSYMAPEQARGEGVGAATDLYATGVLLFELLTGQKPYTGDTPIDTLHAHQNAPVPSLRERVPEAEFSAEIDAVLKRALAKNPGERFASATEFAQALEVVPESVPPTRASSQGLRVATPPATASAEVSGVEPTMPLEVDSAVSPNLIEETPAAPTAASKDRTDARGGDDAGSDQPAPDPSAADAETPPEDHGQAQTATESAPRAGAAATRSPSISDVSGARARPTVERTISVPPAPARGGHRTVIAALLVLLLGGGLWYAGSKLAASPPTTGSAKATADDRDRGDDAPDDEQISGQASDGDDGDDDKAIAAADDDDNGDDGDDNGDDGDDNRDDSGGDTDDGTGDGVAIAGSGDDGADTAQDETTTPVESIDDVKRLINQGKRDEAIRGILKLRRSKFPKSAYLAYLLGNLYFEKVYWSDGLDAYTEAIQLDRSYRNRVTLQRNAIRALGNNGSRPKAYRLFMKHIKGAGLKQLRLAARNDKNPEVRRRAQWVINQLRR